MVYPELVHFLLNHREPKQAEEDLRDIANKICRKLLENWSPKSRTIEGVLKELLKFIWNSKFKSKTLEKDSNKRPIRVLLIDKDCKLCKISDRPIFRGIIKEIHYCAAIGGFLEGLFNYMASKGSMKPNYKGVEVATLSSIGSGDGRCAHLVTFKY